MIIKSILDLDLYKLTVGQLVFEKFRFVKAKYRMTVRNGTAIKFWSYGLVRDMEKEVGQLKNLSLKPEEANYLRKLGLGFTEAYIEFLSNKPMNGCYVMFVNQAGKTISDYDYVPEVEGEWCRAMLYEIFCLSIANELFATYYCHYNNVEMGWLEKAGDIRLQQKIEYLKKNMAGDYSKHPLSISEFGTRRRLSRTWQVYVVAELYKAGVIDATSNVNLAKTYNMPVRGTFGHEFPMGMQAMTRIQDSQKEAFWLWHDYWDGKLSLALDDTLGNKKFLEDFDLGLARTYSGLRHDSGEPKKWADDRINLYGCMNIDASQKVLLFSDGLDVHKANAIRDHVKLRAIPKFGIGTDLTNDTFSPVPQVVMKIVECNGQPVAKLSNNPAKACCDSPEYLTYIKHVAGVKDNLS